MNAQMTPVHSDFIPLACLYLHKSMETKLTKADENKVCRPRDAASGRVLIIRVEIDRSSDNTPRISHRGPDA